MRRHLVVLALVALLPMMLWAGGLTYWSSLQERRVIERGVADAARDLAAAVDQELRESVAALKTVALSRALLAHDVDSFVPVARRLSSIHPEWEALLLFDGQGRLLMDTSRIAGGMLADPGLPAGEANEAVGRVLGGAEISVSNLFHLATQDADAVLVAVPVHDGLGMGTYVLAAALRTIHLNELMPSSSSDRRFAWVEDARGRVIAGAPAAVGENAVSAKAGSRLAGWTVRVGVRSSGVEANLRGSLGVTLGIGIVTLVASLLLARVIAQRILRPVQALSSIVVPVIQDQRPASTEFGITELDALYQALDVLSGELEKSQERFVTFFEAAPVMLFVLDQDGRIIAVNDAWLRTLGYRREEVMARAPWEFHTSASASRMRDQIRPYFLEQGSVDGIGAQYITKAGEVREVLVSLRADRDGKGNVVRTIGAVRDVTEQRRAEAGMARAVEEAERANDAKTRFLAAASHDLRQPLQALSLYLGVLKARLKGGEEQVMEAVGQCVESLTGLLNDMLDVARLDAGVITPKSADVPVNRLLERVAAAWRIQAEAKGLHLDVMPCSAVVHTDPALMDRVLSNLVANAVRYTERGRVLVGCRRVGGDHVRIEVLDTGIGIPADKLGDIFEEFRQLGNPERRRDKGTGLGLSIVRRIADLLGYRLNVRSIPGRGSAFTITLPTANFCTVPVEPPEGGLNPARRILVVDDEVLVRNALELVLAEMGHQVEGAETVEEALKSSRAHRPELVIADFRLAGGTTGIDVIRAVRENCGCDMPAVVLTGDTDPATIRRIVDEGLHLLHKPLRLDALKGFLKQVA
ncbi:MAG TPA: ATP-binding protein [Magnetospirillum sp.]|nr:ATP-binding protein [Magnetospirillum sp.]